MAKDGKDHQFCEYDSCSVLTSLSAVNGSVQWESTVKGSPRWGVFDQYGDVKLGTDKDGHYVYAMFNDTGEGGDEAISIDAGSRYAGCINDGDGSIMHAFFDPKDTNSMRCCAKVMLGVVFKILPIRVSRLNHTCGLSEHNARHIVFPVTEHNSYPSYFFSLLS